MFFSAYISNQRHSQPPSELDSNFEKDIIV